MDTLDKQAVINNNRTYYPQCSTHCTHHPPTASYDNVIQHHSHFRGQSNSQDVSEKCTINFHTYSKKGEFAAHLYICRHSTRE